MLCFPAWLGWFLVAWIHFLLPSTWLHGYLVEVLGSLNSLSGSMDLVPWWRLLASWIQFLFPTHASMVAWRRFLVAWSWVPGSWAWLPGWHGGSLLPCSWYLVAWGWSLAAWFNIWVAWSWFPVPWSWFPGHHCLPGVSAIKHSWDGRVATVQYCMMNDEVSWWAGVNSWLPGITPVVPWCYFPAWLGWFLDSLLGSHDLVPEFTFCFPGLCSMVVRWKFLVAWIWVAGYVDLVPWWRLLATWIWFLVPYAGLNGSLEPFILPVFTSWFPPLGYMVAWWRFPIAWIQFLDPWIWLHGCLVVPGCQDSLSGFLNLFPWLPGEDSKLPRFSSCFPGFRSMVDWWRSLVAWIRFLVLWTWFHHCLVKVPGWLGSLPGSPDFVPWLPRVG